jgi:hypothetical protein
MTRSWRDAGRVPSFGPEEPSETVDPDVVRTTSTLPVPDPESTPPWVPSDLQGRAR